MGKIAIDLGTTNSALAYFHKEKNAFAYLHLGNDGQDFFPSVITYRTGEREPVAIGRQARNRMYAKNMDSYEKFKLQFGADAKNKNGREKSAHEAMRDFVGTAIGAYVNDSGELPEHIVFTVPDNWLGEGRKHPSISMLELLFQEIFMGQPFDVETQITFEVEPIAAAAYYHWELCKKLFEGVLLVVDFGGGTLDLTLCRLLKGGKINVLYHCGAGGDTIEGCAGDAFDHELVKRLSEREGLELTPGTKAFHRFKNSLEDGKIEASAAMNEMLRKYYLAEETQKEAFKKQGAFSFVAGMDEEEYIVTVGDVLDAFAQANAEPLEQMLKKAMEYCLKKEIDIQDEEEFRVIQVGGLSNLICVEAKIRELLQSDLSKEDMRFDDRMNRESRSTAVAHGAAVISEGKVVVDRQCSRTIGMYYYDVYTDQRNKTELIRSGRLRKEYREPVYFEKKLYGEYLGEEEQLALYCEENGQQMEIRVPLRAVCPQNGTPDVWYQLGLSIGQYGVPILHSVNSEGEHREQILAFW